MKTTSICAPTWAIFTSRLLFSARERAAVLETAEAFQVRPQATFSCSKRSLRVSDLLSCRFFTQVAPKCKSTQDTLSMLMRSYVFALYLSNNAIKRFAGYANEKVSVKNYSVFLLLLFLILSGTTTNGANYWKSANRRRKVEVKMIKSLCFLFFGAFTPTT